MLAPRAPDVRPCAQVVLVLGAVVLVLYVATQLFGWDVSLEHRQPPGMQAPAGPEAPWPGSAWQQQQQQQQAQAQYYSAQQQQQQQPYQPGGAQGGRQQQRRYGAGPWPALQQGDVIDVWRQS